MKKILLLTPIYQHAKNQKEFTQIVHQFTSEWVKLGHEVLVIHNLAVYPKIFYLIPTSIKKILSSYLGFPLQHFPVTKQKLYKINGVKICQIPLFQNRPHGNYSSKTIINQFKKILLLLHGKSYSPDVIVGHWTSPQLELIGLLKDHFKTKTCLVMHDNGKSIKDNYPNYKEKMEKIDIWGFRSETLKQEFSHHYKWVMNKFICPSGIPADSILSTTSASKISKKVNSFIFVGTMIKRKYPIVLIKVIPSIYRDCEYSVTYLGEGSEHSTLKKNIRKNNLGNNVNILGKLPRKSVHSMLIESECFIMISRDEVFGLVYLEAMAAGCITIASKGEGFDGIIKHGDNGFLCTAGDINELTTLIMMIKSMTAGQKEVIRTRAIQTARRYRNNEIAHKYINTIINIPAK